MYRYEFMRIYNNFYVFLREGEYTIVSPTAVGEEKGSLDPSPTWKTAFGNGRRSPLVTGNAPVTDQVLQISQER
jgi:hypothetical protein